MEYLSIIDKVIGILAVLGIILAFSLLYSKKTQKYFVPVNCVASFLGLLHSLYIKDLTFIIIQLFIVIILIKKWILKEY